MRTGLSNRQSSRKHWFRSGLLGLAAISGCLGPPASARELSIERITSAPYLGGVSPTDPTWSRDGQQLAFLWNDQATHGRDVWLVGSDGSNLRKLSDFVGRNDAGLESVSDLAWGPEDSALIFAAGNDLYQIELPGSTTPKRILSGASPAYALALSPDGRFLSFLREGDLWLWDQTSGSLTQATKIAQPKIGDSPLNTCCGPGFSRPDVEISRYSWSPDGKYLALSIDDRSGVRRILIPNYLGEETRAEPLRRDYPGDNDHVRDLALYSVSEGRVWRLDLPDNTDRDVASFTWSPNGDRLLIDQFPQSAKHRWIYVVDREERKLQQVWHDYRATRTTQAWKSLWQSDGRGIVFISDKDGRHHLYGLRLGDSKASQLTRGEWSVVNESGAAWMSTHEGQIFFVSTQKSPYERHVYKIPERGGSPKAITELVGIHHPTLSPDGTHLALLHSNDMTPTELYIAGTIDTQPEQRITHSPPPEFDDYDWIEPRYVTFKSHIDGATLHGKILEPRNIDPSRKYPVVLGPVYPNTARKRWGDRQEWRGLNNLIQQYMVLEGGYIVFQVDTRGSYGHGNAFRDQLIRDYGGIDIEDIHSGVKYLTTLPYVDGNHVGLWGTSYGGLMTAMSLFKKPGVYRAGVASSPATNVRHAMTGQVNVAGRPNTHPEIYDSTSAYTYAENLQDHLMLMHGMQDSIVLFKDSVQLAEKLMRAEKDFDLVVLPAAVHEWSVNDYVARYGLTKVVEHFDRYLKEE